MCWKEKRVGQLTAAQGLPVSRQKVESGIQLQQFVFTVKVFISWQLHDTIQNPKISKFYKVANM